MTTSTGVSPRSLVLYSRALRIQGLARLIKDRAFQDDGDQPNHTASEIQEGMDLLCDLLDSLVDDLDRWECDLPVARIEGPTHKRGSR